MAELFLGLYGLIGVMLGAWVGFNGPIRPDNVQRMSALLCIILFWPLFLAHVMRP